jgi:hypothetical protein
VGAKGSCVDARIANVVGILEQMISDRLLIDVYNTTHVGNVQRETDMRARCNRLYNVVHSSRMIDARRFTLARAVLESSRYTKTVEYVSFNDSGNVDCMRFYMTSSATELATYPLVVLLFPDTLAAFMLQQFDNELLLTEV